MATPFQRPTRISSDEPLIIQGGMGMGVSNWRLARAVSLMGHLGVVSGTAIDTILVRRLQDGDPGGHMLRAMSRFPYSAVAEAVWKEFFIPGGKPPTQPYRLLPMMPMQPARRSLEVCVLANFVEVTLAKERHNGRVGLNLLTKIQIPNLASLYGAMLAGVDYVLMGAGIPREVPAALDQLARHKRAALRYHVEGAGAESSYETVFDPKAIFRKRLPELKRPHFIPIIGSATLAILLSKTPGAVQGFVIEGNAAGGHNAPPRGPLQLNDRGEPIYGPRDEADFQRIRSLGLPFWLAGGYGHPRKLAEALALGATGVQVGTAFAFCSESGFAAELKRQVCKGVRQGTLTVFSDPRASPTGFPFKILRLPDSLAESRVYAERPRVCDLGYLRMAYLRADGSIGYRCAGEPVDAYLKKGGCLDDTVGRKCLCNGLQADIGVGQLRADGRREEFLITCGLDLDVIHTLLKSSGGDSYTARDVCEYVMSGVASRGNPHA